MNIRRAIFLYSLLWFLTPVSQSMMRKIPPATTIDSPSIWMMVAYSGVTSDTAERKREVSRERIDCNMSLIVYYFVLFPKEENKKSWQIYNLINMNYMKLLNMEWLRYDKRLQDLLYPKWYKHWAISFIVSWLLSWSLWPNTARDPLCEISQRYGTLNWHILEVRDCRTWVLIEMRDMHNILLQSPLK